MEYLYGLGGAVSGSMAGNGLVQSGLMLLVMGSMLNYVRTFVAAVWDFICRRFFIEVELTQQEDAYRWLMIWIAEHPKNVIMSQQHRVIVQQKSNKIKNYWQKQNQDDIMASEPPELLFVPGEGFHVLWFRNRIILLKRSKDSVPSDMWGINMNNGGQQSQAPKEFVTLYSIGGKGKLQELVHDAMLHSLNKDKEKTIIFVLDQMHGSTWSRALARPKRSFDSVILDSNVSEDIMSDAQEFLSSADWYRQLGVPYRRSYLLHGKPGCGKTSFVTALAGKLNLNVCVVSLANINMTDSVLTQAFRDAPESCILLIEDIDAAFPTREDHHNLQGAPPELMMMMRANNRPTSSVTFSGILNAIDGIASQEGRIIVMTTNTIEKLDPALIRPGRVDRMVEFNLATASQGHKLFSRFYPEEPDLADKFVDGWPEDTLSMASIQGLFMRFKTDPVGAYNFLPRMIEETRRRSDAHKAEQRRRQEEHTQKLRELMESQ